MSDAHMIPTDRLEYCSKCRQTTTHQWRVYPDVVYKKCTRCGRKTTQNYSGPIDDLFAESSQSITDQEIEHLSREVNDISLKIHNHHWSKNMGQKDSSILEWIITALFHLRGDIDKLHK